ncbi:MAG: hypothetical protein HGA96_17865 [Desulfobulbaceae bacterium]|nr:hypothetical protein [Desulfobulbaceae bacterium]
MAKDDRRHRGRRDRSGHCPPGQRRQAHPGAAQDHDEYAIAEELDGKGAGWLEKVRADQDRDGSRVGSCRPDWLYV